VPYNTSASVLRDSRRFCWLSGWTASCGPKGWFGPRILHVAHIASGGSRAVRVDDRRAVILLHPLCHDLHVSNSETFSSKVINGVRYPTIDERHTLFLKKILDPDYYDPEYLQSIWIGKLPPPEMPPNRWLEEIFNNQGILF
jgi:hypothetical protein